MYLKSCISTLASCVKLAQWQVVWRLFGSFPSHLAVGLLQWLRLDTVNFITAQNTKESIFKLVFYSSYDIELLQGFWRVFEIEIMSIFLLTEGLNSCQTE